VLALSFPPDGHRLACGRADGAVELWDVAACAIIKAWMGHAGAVCELRFTDRSDRLWTAGSDGAILLWDLEKLEEAARINVNEAAPATSNGQT
jgi:WD40 repeat protein